MVDEVLLTMQHPASGVLVVGAVAGRLTPRSEPGPVRVRAQRIVRVEVRARLNICRRRRDRVQARRYRDFRVREDRVDVAERARELQDLSCLDRESADGHGCLLVEFTWTVARNDYAMPQVFHGLESCRTRRRPRH